MITKTTISNPTRSRIQHFISDSLLIRFRDRHDTLHGKSHPSSSTRTFLAMVIFSEAWKREIQEKRNDPILSSNSPKNTHAVEHADRVRSFRIPARSSRMMRRRLQSSIVVKSGRAAVRCIRLVRRTVQRISSHAWQRPKENRSYGASAVRSCPGKTRTCRRLVRNVSTHCSMTKNRFANPIRK